LLVLKRQPGNRGRDKINITIDGKRVAQIKALEIIDNEVVLAFTAPPEVQIARTEAKSKSS
jgi:sRNA-binding carbon storage regulator CsrA